jgi:hypothetical protein
MIGPRGIVWEMAGNGSHVLFEFQLRGCELGGTCWCLLGEGVKVCLCMWLYAFTFTMCLVLVQLFLELFCRMRPPTFTTSLTQHPC